MLVDWGSTNLRAYLLDEEGRLVDTRSSKAGIKHIRKPEIPGILKDLVDTWQAVHTIQAVLLAGMIGGDLGWREVAPIACPAGAAEIGAAIYDAGLLDGIPVAIVPGVYSLVNGSLAGMMRGEEVQIAGSLDLTGRQDAVFCLPGTHTKWVDVEAGRIFGIVTSMTGEVFDFLSSNSVIAGSIATADETIDPPAFLHGVEIAEMGYGALQSVFNARAQKVLGIVRDPIVLRSQTSGILIGSEVRAMLDRHRPATPIYVVSSQSLGRLYVDTIRHLGHEALLVDDAKAFVAGGTALVRVAVRSGRLPALDVEGSGRQSQPEDQIS